MINTLVVQTKASILGLLLMFSGLPFYFFFKKTWKGNP